MTRKRLSASSHVDTQLRRHDVRTLDALDAEPAELSLVHVTRHDDALYDCCVDVVSRCVELEAKLLSLVVGAKKRKNDILEPAHE